MMKKIMVCLLISQAAYAGKTATELSPAFKETLAKAQSFMSDAHERGLDQVEACDALSHLEGISSEVLDQVCMDPTDCLNNAGNNYNTQWNNCNTRPVAKQEACFGQAQSNYSTNRHLCMQAQQNFVVPTPPINTNLNINVGIPSIPMPQPPRVVSERIMSGITNVVPSGHYQMR